MAFAGSWYPAEREDCLREIASYREANGAAARAAPGGGLSHIGIVPHAGWVFSGRLAALTFQSLVEDPQVALVVLLGGHLRPADPIVAMVEGEWATPLGAFAIHEGFRGELERFPGLVLEGPGHCRPDNSTELQLPFAKAKYPAAELLPIRVPPAATAIELGRCLAGYLAAFEGRAVVVASTDLTHYGPNYDYEPKGRGPSALAWVTGHNDPAFVEAVEGGDGPAILDSARRNHNACSAGSVAAANEIARSRGGRFHPLGYGTSADVSGESAENFVGYLSGIFV